MTRIEIRITTVVLLHVALLACGCSQGTAKPPLDDAGGGDAGGCNSSDAGFGLQTAAGADSGVVVTIPLSACNPNVYAAEFTIGGSQEFELLLDTGSTTLAVAATGCTSCSSAGVSSLYTPGPTAVDQGRMASATYGALDPSGWSGEIYSDWVGTPSSPQLAKVDLVAISQQSEFLVGYCGCGVTPQGVIGFAPSKDATAGTNGFFDQLVAAGSVSDVFSVWFCGTGGTLWLGGYDPAFTTAPPVYTPMAPPGFDAYVYTVTLASIGVLGTTIPVPTGEYTAALLDTGSSISSMQPTAFAALTAAVTESAAFTQIFGGSASTFFSNPNNCVDLSQTKEELDAALPPLTLTFGSSPGVSVQATATESYLLSSGGKWCPAMTSRTPDPNFQDIAAILGAPILASNVVVFDRAHQQVGFAPHVACP